MSQYLKVYMGIGSARSSQKKLLLHTYRWPWGLEPLGATCNLAAPGLDVHGRLRRLIPWVGRGSTALSSGRHRGRGKG